MSFSQRLQRLNEKKAFEAVSDEQATKGEIVQLNQPDNIPNDVWLLIQDNGRLATQRLNELLNSQRFHRLKASDQARLISLAQDRAFGRPDAGQKRITKTVSHELSDETARALNKANARLSLPEYSRQTPQRPVDDPTQPDELQALSGALRGSQDVK